MGPVNAIGVEPAGALQGRVGDGGISRTTWRSLVVRGVEAAAELAGAADAGIVPHLVHAHDPRLGAAVGKLVRAWRAEERLVLMGDAGAVAGASLLGLPPGTRCITDPSDASAADVKGAGLIVLGNVPWVVAARDVVAGNATRLWQVDGDGTAETTPRRKGQSRVNVAGGSDPRFVTCSRSRWRSVHAGHAHGLVGRYPAVRGCDTRSVPGRTTRRWRSQLAVGSRKGLTGRSGPCRWLLPWRGIAHGSGGVHDPSASRSVRHLPAGVGRGRAGRWWPRPRSRWPAGPLGGPGRVWWRTGRGRGWSGPGRSGGGTLRSGSWARSDAASRLPWSGS